MKFSEMMLIAVACMAMASPCMAKEMRFRVRHDHLWGACSGELVFGEKEVQYLSAKSKEQRSWTYDQMRQVDLLSPGEILMQTYFAGVTRFGRSQVYRFKLLDQPASESLRLFLQAKMPRPMLSAVVPGDGHPSFVIPVRHRHTLGGCQGVIEVSDHLLVFRASDGRDSRMWHYEDIQALSSLSPFDMRINVFEGATMSNQYLFELKKRMDPAAYDFIWWRINPGISTRKPPGS